MWLSPSKGHHSGSLTYYTQGRPPSYLYCSHAACVFRPTSPSAFLVVREAYYSPLSSQVDHPFTKTCDKKEPIEFIDSSCSSSTVTCTICWTDMSLRASLIYAVAPAAVLLSRTCEECIFPDQYLDVRSPRRLVLF